MDDKKVERKRRRFAARLKHKYINCTETPDRNIVLCNVGQATGFKKSDVLNLIRNNAVDVCVPKFISEKGETYSFLVFKNTEDASKFYKMFNGKGMVDNIGTPLYMNYVEDVPVTDIILPDNPNGLIILNNFISEAEEREYIDLFDWTPDINVGNLKNRQVKHYGYEFRYGSNDVDLDNPLSENIPSQCDVLWERLKEHGFNLGVPDQLTVNKYLPGQGIPNHVDRHSPFGETILSLSLCSSVVMEWKHHTGISVPVLVPQRSMLIMQGEARYDWQHGIQPRTVDPVIETQIIDNKTVKVITDDTVPRQTRISLTFRWTRRGPCECIYETLCDRNNEFSNEIDDDVAAKLENLHVHQVYEEIACHFSSTRHSVWPRVARFMSEAQLGDIVIDLGAGNGKNVLHRTDIIQLAGELSSGLISECRARTLEVATAQCVRLDALRPNLRHRCADRLLCIAVVHHFTTHARRLKAISVMYDLLRPSGVALITVWAKDQTKSNYLCKTKVENKLTERVTVAGVNLPVHENRTQFQHQDLLVPWKLRKKMDNNKLQDKAEFTLLRYYHVFEEGELDKLCLQAGFQIQDSFYEEGNWCVICKKPSIV